MAMISVGNFSEVGKRKLLRFGANYVTFWTSAQGNVFGFANTMPLKDFVKFASTQIIRKDKVLESYQLIDLNNVEPGLGILMDLEQNIVAEIGSDKVFLGDADIAFSKLNSHIGYVFLVSDLASKEFAPIGSTEFYPLLVDQAIMHPKLLKYFFLHRKFRDCAFLLKAGKSQSHPRLQKDDLLNLRLPVLTMAQQDKLLALINSEENKILEIRSKIESIQQIIDEVLIENRITKKEQSLSGKTIFNASLKDIAKNKALRTGARYNNFWVSYDGNLFLPKKEFPMKRLKDVLGIGDRQLLKKGLLGSPYILIDFDQVTPLYGRIHDFENIVTEIGSDKLVFGDCSILTNKLRPYLGYTILNPFIDNMIGTTEFIPLKIRDEKILLREYLRYLLLSNEYIAKSQFLASGNEHPRISPIDLLNIRIPIPEIQIQKKIIEEIHVKETRSNQLKKEYTDLRNQLDDSIEQFLKG
jgi:type I restriction enzyme S subunit